MKTFISSSLDHLNHRLIKILVTMVLIPLPVSYEAFASGGLGNALNPVQNSIVNITQFIQGPAARGVVIIAIIICGGMWFMNRQGQHAQTLGRIAIGAVLIFAAGPVFNVVMPNSGAGAGI